MPWGKIVSVPNTYSNYGRVKDEYGEEYDVHASEIDGEAKEGDDYAYHVDIWQNETTNATTLRRGNTGPEEKP